MISLKKIAAHNMNSLADTLCKKEHLQLESFGKKEEGI
jgi:hypothetical protein